MSHHDNRAAREFPLHSRQHGPLRVDVHRAGELVQEEHRAARGPALQDTAGEAEDLPLAVAERRLGQDAVQSALDLRHFPEAQVRQHRLALLWGGCPCRIEVLGNGAPGGQEDCILGYGDELLPNLLAVD